jgi:hypothetical protein
MEIVFEEPSKVIKENEVQTYPKWIINIGQIAAGAWDAVLLGIEPKLFKGYQISVSPNVRENL